MAATWAKKNGGVMPPAGVEFAQSVVVKRALDKLVALSVVDQRRPPSRANLATVSAIARTVPSPSQVNTDADAVITDDLWNHLRTEFLVEPATTVNRTSSSAEMSHFGDSGDELFKCRTCLKMAPETAFYRSASTKRGFGYVCKPCKNKQNKEWREAKKKRDQEAEPASEAIGTAIAELAYNGT